MARNATQEFDRPRQLGPDDFGLRRAVALLENDDTPPPPDDAVLHSHVQVNLETLANEIRRDRLCEIALLTRALTYGEMMEYVTALIDSKNGESLNADDFAKMLDAWAKRTLSGNIANQAV